MLSLGIDCAQLQHAFCLMDETGRILVEGSIPETNRGLADLSRLLEGHGTPTTVLMEASGNCWQNLHAQLHAFGWQPKALDPLRARRFAQLHSPRHKTDKADARSLALMGLGNERASVDSDAARTLAASLASAIDQRVMLLNQLHAILVVANPAIIACGWELDAARTLAVLRSYPTTFQLRRARTLARLRFGPRHRVGAKAAQALQTGSREALCGAINQAHPQQVCFLVEQIGAWSVQLSSLEAHLHALLPQAERLASIKGVGLRTALIVFARLPFRQLASAKQAAAHVGLHPPRFESNQRAWTRLSKQGDAIARTALYRVALPAITHNPRCASFYQQLRANGKTHKQALCAVAHKLIRIFYALVRDQVTYSPDLLPGGA